MFHFLHLMFLYLDYSEYFQPCFLKAMTALKASCCNLALGTKLHLTNTVVVNKLVFVTHVLHVVLVLHNSGWQANWTAWTCVASTNIVSVLMTKVKDIAKHMCVTIATVG